MTVASLLLAGGRRFRVVTYNVENLFDTCHDAGKRDQEFLPGAERRWTSARYRKKLADLARTLAAAGGSEPASLIGLCEVENDSTLRDLTQRTMLRRLGYEYIVTRSPDARGIDVALLFQPGRFRVLDFRSLRVPYRAPAERPTRDILWVAGLVPTGDTLDVFVCHLPSRAGGAARTESYRCRAAALLRSHIDSLTARRGKARVLIMGDFNDEPSDRSLTRALGVRQPVPASQEDTADPRALYVLSATAKGREGVKGTYRYRGTWNRLDQIIVSGSLLLPKEGFRTSAANCQIVSPDFLLEPDATYGGVKPRRTYQGTFYHGGVSDHLPLAVDFFY